MEHPQGTLLKIRQNTTDDVIFSDKIKKLEKLITRTEEILMEEIGVQVNITLMQKR